MPASEPAWTVIRPGKLIDAQGGPPQTGQAVVIQGSTIHWVGPIESAEAPGGPLAANKIYQTLDYPNATLLPVAFVSNVFISVRNDPPAWLDLLGDIFPLKAFADSFFAAFDPFEEGSAYKPWLLLRIGLWGLAGALVAAGKFRWEPSTGTGGGSQRSRRRGRR